MIRNILRLLCRQYHPLAAAIIGLLCLAGPCLGQYYYNGFWYSLDGTNITITSYNGNNSVVEFPSAIPGVDASVTAIGDRVLQRKQLVTGVIIPSSVTAIGQNAFGLCPALQWISVGTNNAKFSSTNGVLFDKNQTTLIACPSGMVGEYTVPNTVKSLSDKSFNNCSSLTNIYLPSDLTNIGSYAFYTCSRLVSVEIPNSVTQILDGAFANCYSVTNILIPDNVAFIGAYSFANCGNLININLPHGLTNIAPGTFRACVGLSGINIPNSVTSIGSNAFQYCDGLAYVAIPNSVTFIGNSAFSECSKLAGVTLPDKLSVINYSLFSMCYELTNIIIPDSVTFIGSGAFSTCTHLTNITVPNGVTAIDSGAFARSRSLTNINLPSSLVKIGDRVFEESSALQTINVDSNNIFFSSLNGVLFDKSQSVLICCPIGISGEYTIPSSVSCITNHAFFWCVNLGRVFIPASVTNIQRWAFAITGITNAYFQGDAPALFGSLTFNSNFTIYYPSTASGWSTPTWNDYNAQPYEYNPPSKRALLSLAREADSVIPLFTQLTPGAIYQLQVSSDLPNWSDSGEPFTATNASQTGAQTFDLTNAANLFFRLKASP